MESIFDDQEKRSQFIDNCILKCKEYIHEIIENNHPGYIEFEFEFELGDIYVIEFNNIYNDPRVNNELWNSGKQLFYVTKSFLKLHNDVFKILEFIEIFMTHQLKDFFDLYSDLLYK
jgi:hypothetical protein